MSLALLDDLPKPKTTELLQKGVESVQEYSALDEREEVRRWRVFRIGDQEHRVDMKAIEPYKRVISHGGQCDKWHTHINTTTWSVSTFVLIYQIIKLSYNCVWRELSKCFNCVSVVDI